MTKLQTDRRQKYLMKETVSCFPQHILYNGFLQAFVQVIKGVKGRVHATGHVDVSW